jgi:hypothetical protein
MQPMQPLFYKRPKKTSPIGKGLIRVSQDHEKEMDLIQYGSQHNIRLIALEILKGSIDFTTLSRYQLMLAMTCLHNDSILRKVIMEIVEYNEYNDL